MLCALNSYIKKAFRLGISYVVNNDGTCSAQLVFWGTMLVYHDRLVLCRHADENEKLKLIFEGCY